MLLSESKCEKEIQSKNMKKLSFICVFFSIFLFFANLAPAQDLYKEKIILKAKIIKIGEKPSIYSGARRLVFQLVKYEVEKVVRGKYDRKYVVVDHLYYFGNRLAEFNEGDFVKLELLPKKKLSVITTETGIREEDEVVDIFYIPLKISK